MYAKIHIYPDFYTPYWVLINMFSRNSGGGGGVDVGGVDGGVDFGGVGGAGGGGGGVDT